MPARWQTGMSAPPDTEISHSRESAMKVMIGNDHGGYEVKTELVTHLREKGIEVADVGCDSEEIVRYPHYSRVVAGAVARGEAARGILICSTGIGMSIVANKVKGGACGAVHGYDHGEDDASA